MSIDKLYTQHHQEIKQLYKKLSDQLDCLPNSDDESIEEDLISRALYKLNEALGDAAYITDYCMKEVKEGYLKDSPYNEGRYVLGKHEFTCGAPVEIFLWGKWYKGRTECGDEYYFVGAGNPTFEQLKKNKIKVRIRV